MDNQPPTSPPLRRDESRLYTPCSHTSKIYKNQYKIPPQPQQGQKNISKPNNTKPKSPTDTHGIPITHSPDISPLSRNKVLIIKKNLKNQAPKGWHNSAKGVSPSEKGWHNSAKGVSPSRLTKSLQILSNRIKSHQTPPNRTK
jgi:hypothetical protein